MKKLLISLLLCSMCLNSIGQKNDFKVKGFHIDCRVQVMTPSALKSFAKELSDMGINTIVMEYEATFPFQNHAIITNKYGYTPAQIDDFVSYCESLGVDVIPLQQSFGHVEYILRHARYEPLREVYQSEVSQICPLNPQAAPLFKELFTEIAAKHKSEFIHIGGDETYLLGLCPKCSKYVEQNGKSKLFVTYIKKMCQYVEELGKRPVIWADIITKYPEAIKELPSNAILVNWNYGWAIRHFGDMSNIYSAGIEMWGAPALRSGPDNYYTTSWNKHFNNISDFIPYCREQSYKGIIMTSWSTSGIYGLLLEPGVEVIEMDPVRYVYPMNGFRILVASYAASLNQQNPLDTKEFTKNYSVERFGISPAQALELYEILYTPQIQLKEVTPINSKLTLDEIIKINQVAQATLTSIKPITNINEFEHFRLMFDIRGQYLAFKAVEAKVNSHSFNRSQAASALKELKVVMAASKELDRRYITLNRGYISDDELLEQNTVRVRKMNILAKKLEAISN